MVFSLREETKRAASLLITPLNLQQMALIYQLIDLLILLYNLLSGKGLKFTGIV
jgi:hypothetical protein